MAVALQFGAGCHNCPGTTKCKDRPAKNDPLILECPECGGAGCKECNKKGKIYINDCPLRAIPPETWDFIDMAVLYLEHGLPPIAGGQLDQAKCFLDGAKYVMRLREFHKK